MDLNVELSMPFRMPPKIVPLLENFLHNRVFRLAKTKKNSERIAETGRMCTAARLPGLEIRTVLLRGPPAP